MTNSDVISILNDLIETSKDGEYGFRACAEHAKSADLRSVFTQRMQDCKKAASELQAQVVLLGGEPDTSGTATGAMHRGWVAVRATLAGYNDQTLLNESERGEDTALDSYRKALKNELPVSVQSLVQAQFDGAKRNHDQIRMLRDRAKATL